jgi:hypothetical protein
LAPGQISVQNKHIDTMPCSLILYCGYSFGKESV